MDAARGSPSDSPSDSPRSVQRLTEALELWLAHRRAPMESTVAFLQRHVSLRDLLEPLAAEPNDDAASMAPTGEGPDDADGSRTFGEFRLLREIARGGMGIVHEAVQIGLGRRVALKVLAMPLAQSPHAVARFRREAELLARLSHPHIVPVHAAGIVDGVPFHAMELIDGGTLADVLRQLAGTPRDRLDGGSLQRAFAAALGDPDAGADLRGKSHVDACLGVLLAIAAALACAHEAGILHRDVKPANVLLRRDGQPLLSDFGLARDQSDPALSRTGDFAGTPFYVSPEQAAGERARIGPATDVFSLAVLGYELLLLERPFDGDTSALVLERVRRAEPPALARRDHGLPGDLVAVLDKALRKDPADRYPSIAAFAAELEAVRALRPVHARRRGGWTRVVQRWRAEPQRALLQMLVVGSLATAGALGAYVWWQQPAIVAAATSARMVEVERLLETMLLEQDHGEESGGLEPAQAALALLPNQPEVLAAMVSSTFRVGDLATSAAHLERLRHIAPDVAAQLGAKIAEAEPTTALGWFVRGVRYIDEAHQDGDQAKYRLAATALRRAMDRADAPRAMFHGQLLHALVHLREFATIRELAADMRHLWPESPFGAYWRGFALQYSDAPGAKEELQLAMRLAPDLPQPVLRLAKLVEHEGDAEQAAALYRQALVLSPKATAARLGLARLLSARGLRQQALAEIDTALATRPESYLVHATRGQELGRLGRHDEAMAEFELAFTHGSKAATPRVVRAEYRIERGRAKEALADAEEAVRLEPNLARAHSTHGIALLHVGRHADAVGCFERVVGFEPNNVHAWRSLAQARRRSDDLDGALAAIDRALQLRPDDLQTLPELGKVQRARQDRDGAERTFRRVLQRIPDHYESLVNLAGLCWQRGAHEESLQLLAAARAKDAKPNEAWLPAFDFLAQLDRRRECLLLRADYCACHPKDRGQRLNLVRQLLAIAPAPGDDALLQRTFTELAAIDGTERDDVAALRQQAGARLSSAAGR